jgi:hypothetical protein
VKGAKQAGDWQSKTGDRQRRSADIPDHADVDAENGFSTKRHMPSHLGKASGTAT